MNRSLTTKLILVNSYIKRDGWVERKIENIIKGGGLKIYWTAFQITNEIWLKFFGLPAPITIGKLSYNKKRLKQKVVDVLHESYKFERKFSSESRIYMWRLTETDED